MALAEDLGIPAGRNAGVPAVGGELLVFIDDDVRLGAPDVLARIEDAVRREPDARAAAAARRASDGGPRPRDWVPRLRVGDPERSSDVTAVWEGAVAIRRALLERVGGWPDAFRLVHEGVDLAWRVMDRGYRVAYAGDIAVAAPQLRDGAARLLGLLRGAQPGVARSSPSASAARRALRARASRSAACRCCARRRAPARRCAATATGFASRAARVAAAREDSVADDTRRSASADLATSLSAP